MRQLFVAPAETGRRVRLWRERYGWSQRDLATRAGLSHRTVLKVEKGYGVTVATLEAVAGALGASADDLLGPRRKARL
jgi:transcriptional regulator with XRE-family HTH domain